MQEEDSCEDKSLNMKLNTSSHVSGELGFGENNDSEVNKVAEIDLSPKIEASSLDSKRVFGEIEVNEDDKVKEVKDSGKSGEIKALSPPSKEDSSSLEIQFENPVGDEVSSEVDKVKNLTVEVENQAEIEAHVDEHGVLEDCRGVNDVVDSEECVRNESEDGKRVFEDNKVFNDACVSTKEAKDSEKLGEIEAVSLKEQFQSERTDKANKSTVELKKKAEFEAHVDEHGVSEDCRGVNDVDSEDSARNETEDGKVKDVFCVSDLVWGKVTTHPWWPGQIFEPRDALKKARKYYKSKGFLVGFFGDRTFAWNVEANLKPFVPNFSEMVKQTDMAAFRNALGCVLDEISRRVEYELSCGCIAEDVYNRLKTQVIINGGIRKESKIRQGGDRFLTASSFEPGKFLDYVKGMAQGPHTDVDKLEHVIARAQMASFYRWKGIYHLAEFGPLIGYVNNEADAPVTVETEGCEATNDKALPVEAMEEVSTAPKKRKKSESGDSDHSIIKEDKKSVSKKGDKGTIGNPGIKSSSSSGKKRCKVTNDETPSAETTEDDSPRPQKRKKLSKHDGNGHSIKKEKLSLDLGKKSVTKKGDKGMVGKPGIKSISSSGKKQQGAKLLGNDSNVKGSSALETTMQAKDAESPSKVGERFLKVAGLLRQQPPLLKSDK